MKKQIIYLALSIISILNFTSCNTATPEKYFNTAVLNTNLLSGFADNGMMRQLESPSVKLEEKSGETTPMKNSEVIKDKIKSVEETLTEVKDLKVTEETKDMLQASISLYQFVLPVYKNEYLQIAESLDKKESAEKIDSEANAIHEKYFAKYNELYKKLISFGKVYAEKNNIKVNWNEN